MSQAGTVPSKDSQRQQPEPALPMLSAAISFVKRSPVAVGLSSALILLPCYWHRYIETCDLPSHTYNAWLASLIEQGKAPGLLIAQQWQNILFDYILYGLTQLFGYGAGERIAVSVCILLFFWGAYALVSALTVRPAWPALPILAMLTYGWVFQMGFMNCYISIGLACLAMALVYRGNRTEILFAIVLGVLTLFAHLLGFALLLCCALYLALARKLQGRALIALPLASLALFFAIRFIVVHRFQLMAREWPIYWMGGADQFILYRPEYRWIAYAILALCLVQLVISLLRKAWRPTHSPVALSLYAVAAVAFYFSPGGIWPEHDPVGMAFLPDRISLMVAVLGCALLVSLRPRRFIIGVLACVGVLQFAFLYRDTGAISAVEESARAAVRTLPPNAHVIGSFAVRDSRVAIDHIVERACIDHCFIYSNYEPSTSQFRVRAMRDNPFVTHDSRDSRRMQLGEYVVKSSDPSPLYQLYSCGPKQDGICIRELTPGMVNGAGLRFTSLDRN